LRWLFLCAWPAPAALQASTTTALTICGASLLVSVAVNAPGAGSPGGTIRFLDAAPGPAALLVTNPARPLSAPITVTTSARPPRK